MLMRRLLAGRGGKRLRRVRIFERQILHVLGQHADLRHPLAAADRRYVSDILLDLRPPIGR